jgi:putative transposase
MERLWTIITDELYLLTLLYQIEIHAFVLMPNHFHLILSVPNSDLGKIMDLLMSSVTKRVNSATGRIGHLFGGPYYWSIITSSRYFGHAFKYVYRNPVKGAFCRRVEDYPFSSIHGLVGNGHLPFPISYTRLGAEINLPDIDHIETWLYWLNQPFPNETEGLIKKLLRKKEIKVLLRRSSRIPYEELAQLI